MAVAAYKHQGITEQSRAAFKRKSDAWALHGKGTPHARGAVYLGGYAVECKVKAIAMERYGCRTLGQLAVRKRIDERTVFAHGLEALIRDLISEAVFRSLLKGEAGNAFRQQVAAWSPQWRYDSRDLSSEEAEKFLNAIETVYAWLGSNRA